MTLRTRFLILASTLLIACGSEAGAPGGKPNIAPPPGLTPPGDDAGPVDPGPTDPGPMDPSTDGGTDPTTDGGTDADTDGDVTDPTDPVDDGGTSDPNDGGVTDPGDQDAGTTDPGDQDAGGGSDDPGPPTHVTVGGVTIDFVSQNGNTFCYQVTEIKDCQDLSHWDLATNCTVLSGTPTSGFVIGKDPKSGLTGVKWNVTGSFETGLFCVTVAGTPTLGTDDVASKSGYPISFGKLAGPVCQ